MAPGFFALCSSGMDDDLRVGVFLQAGRAALSEKLRAGWLKRAESDIDERQFGKLGNSVAWQ